MIGDEFLDKDDFIAALCHAYYDRLFSFLRNYCYTKEYAEDILQETFLAAYKNADNLMNHPNIKGWLYKTAHNKALKENKKIQTQLYRQLYIEEHPEAILKVSEESDRQSKLDVCVWDITKIIEPEELNMLMLLYVNDYTYSEIAQVYHFPVNTVKTKISRIKQKIRRKYDMT